MNETLAKTIAVNAKEKILTQYHWEYHIDELNKLLSSTKDFEIRN